jgi:3-phosphoshikimate 1-carboxyvinyltransferase
MIKVKIKIPGDKSMSHRAALFSALRNGKSVFTNFNLNNDCAATLSCLSEMGLKYHQEKDKITLWGKHPFDWQKPSLMLDAGNSGTTARLISGILASLKFETKLTGDDSLSKRPMKRVITPLKMMGANIESKNDLLPLHFKPAERLKGIEYRLPMASAQVKSAVLLAGLFAEGVTSVVENMTTRDHTERMLGLKTKMNGLEKIIYVSKESEIPDISMEIPGDFSSAAFFISAALLIPGSNLLIEGVSLNPTRIGYLKILRQMGARIDYEIRQEVPEPIGSINVQFSKLKNIVIPRDIVPNIIDEIPILSVVASQAEGIMELHNAEELRFKESDRINTIVQNLSVLGIKINEFQDGLSIEGPQQIKGGKITTQGDHRIAMAFTIASLIAKENVIIDNPDCAAVSFPEFYNILKSVKNG